MRKITGIIVHCTATRADWWSGKSLAKKISEVKRWHVVDRGWSDCGYHYLIDRDGKVGTARPIVRNGAHVRGHNAGTIGVSLFGGHGSSAEDAFADNFTPQQDAALRRLIGNLRADYGPVSVSGHNEYAAKACPGFMVSPWLASVLTPKPNRLRAASEVPAPAHWLTALLQSLFGGKS